MTAINNRIDQRPTEIRHGNRYLIPALIFPISLAVTQLARAKKVQMNISSLAVQRVFEMVVFTIRQ